MSFLTNRRGCLLLVLAAGCGSGDSGSVPRYSSTGGDASTSGPSGPDGAAMSNLDGSSVTTGNDGAASDASAGGDSGNEAAGPPQRWVAYASGYGPNIGVYSVSQTDGTLTSVQSIASFGSSPSFLAVNRTVTNLYAVDENPTGRVGAYSIDSATGKLTFLNAVSSGGNAPPFVTVDATGKCVLVANYGGGTTSVLPVQANGGLGNPASTLNVGAIAHMILPDPSNLFLFVPCLGADYIAQFTFDATTGILTPNATQQVNAASGAGPRHIAFHPNGHFAYVLNETNSTVATYAFDATQGTLSVIDTQSSLPSGFTGTNTAAEIWIHPSGAWLLASNRGADDIAVFSVDATTSKLASKDFTASGGTTPRDFTLAPGGAFVYAANQGSGNVVPFRFDASAGTLTATASPITVPSASFVGVVALP